MTSPWDNPPQLPTGPRVEPPILPAQTLTITVPDLPCGHLPEDLHDAKCAYWRGVASGEYHSPDAYLVDGVFTIPPHAPGLLPLTDPALRGAA